MVICAICQDILGAPSDQEPNGAKVIIARCGHRFDKICLLRMLTASLRESGRCLSKVPCPICREFIRGTDVVPTTHEDILAMSERIARLPSSG